MTLRVVGKNIVKPDAYDKVTGQALYAGDLKRPGMLFGKAVRSPYAHAKILSIDPGPALEVPGVQAVLTARDIPGENHVGMTGTKDQLVLAEEKVRFMGEAVAVVAAETQEAAEEAVGRVVVKYQALPVIETPEQGLGDGAVKISPEGNLCWHKKVVRGDWAAAVEKAAVVVKGEYRTPRVEHAYLEPEAVLAEPVDDGILVWSSTKSVHLDRREIARILGWPLERVQVTAAYIGGSFGGKSDLPLNCMASLLCWKTGRPVSMTLEREESIQTTTKRHACVLRYIHAADAQGRLTAVKMEAIGDAGGYADYTASVMQRMIVHGAGPYRAPNVWLEGWGVLTNNPVCGAMRGFGTPQVAFACERQMDRLAEKLGIDPVDFRLRNVLKKGDIFTTGQAVEHEPGLQEGLLKAREIMAAFPPFPSHPEEKAAWGLACFYYGNGRTGMGDEGVATFRLLEDGRVQVAVGSPDIGQGSDTVLVQIAAEALGLEIDQISLVSADTRQTLDSGTTSGTRLTVVVGRAVKDGAEEWRRLLFLTAASILGVPVEDLRFDSSTEKPRLVSSRGYLSFSDIYKKVRARAINLEVTKRHTYATTPLDPENGQGSPYGVYTYGVQLAGLSVDECTGKANLKRLISVLNIGRPINPVLLEGQVAGGVCMGAGYALTEEIKLKEGKVLNPRFSSYLLLTSLDIPPVECVVLPLNDQKGPYGAVGIGEPATIPVAAAIANAVSRAAGAQFFNLPLRPEDIVHKTKELRTKNTEVRKNW